MYHQWERGKAALGFGADGCHGNRKLPLTYNGENDVSMLTPSVLICSSSNWQVTRTDIKAWTTYNGKIVSRS